MYELVAEAISGLFRGMFMGTVAFIAVMALSVVYRYFTSEKLSSFIGIVFGLGFLGFAGGLLAVLEQPTFGGAIEIVAVTILAVWGVNIGDKIAEKIPKRSASAIFGGIIAGKSAYRTVKLPNSRLIFDMVGKPRVPDDVRNELSEREFTLPADLPVEDISQRIKRRLITDWGIGDAELELDQEGKIIHLAISAKEKGLSLSIPEDNVAIPIECKVFPSNLAPGDLVKIFFENDAIIEGIEVNGVDRNRGIMTIIAKASLLEKIRGEKASLVIALPATTQRQKEISVEQKSGVIEEFKIQKIVNSLRKLGVKETTANEIVVRVQKKLSKMDPPVSTRLIKTAIIEEMEKECPEAVGRMRLRKFWRGHFSKNDLL